MKPGYVHGTWSNTWALVMYMELCYALGDRLRAWTLVVYMDPAYVHGTWLCT